MALLLVKSRYRQQVNIIIDSTQCGSLRYTKQNIIMTHLDHFIPIIHTNSGDKLGAEDVLIESQDQRGFAAGGIAHHEKADDVGAFCSHLEGARGCWRLGHVVGDR